MVHNFFLNIHGGLRFLEFLNCLSYLISTSRLKHVLSRSTDIGTHSNQRLLCQVDLFHQFAATLLQLIYLVHALLKRLQIKSFLAAPKIQHLKRIHELGDHLRLLFSHESPIIRFLLLVCLVLSLS
jgi:hypothetical protein